MKANTVSPEGEKILREHAASLRASVETLEAKLSTAILYGAGWAILQLDSSGPGEPYWRAAGRWDERGNYRPDAERGWKTVAILGDWFTGLSLFSPEDADRHLAKLRAERPLVDFVRKHIRTLQEERLADCRAMLATTLQMGEKLGLTL